MNARDGGVAIRQYAVITDVIAHSVVLLPDADEIEGIKKYFERGQLPPGAAGDAFGRPVGEVYGPPVPSVSPDGAQKHP